MVKWWDSGPGAEERARQKEEEAKRKSSGSFRVWQKPGQTCKITIVTENYEYFTEHTFQSAGGQWERHACLEGAYKDANGNLIACPYCLAKHKKDFQVYVGTCINHTGFTTKDGDEVKFVRQALVLKSQCKNAFIKKRNKLQAKYGEKWRLPFSTWEIERDVGQSSQTPGIFVDFIGMTPKDKLIEMMKAAGHKRDDWDAAFEAISMSSLTTCLPIEQAYSLMGIPLNIARGGIKEVDPDAEEAEYDANIDFPGDVAGSNQFDSFEDIDIPLAEPDIPEADDDDVKALEEYEALK